MMEMIESGGNVFADLGLQDSSALQLKSVVAQQINQIVAGRHLTQEQAAAILGVAQPKVSALRNGRLNGFSLERLMTFMLRLDRNVEISFKKKSTGNDPARITISAGKTRIATAA